MSKPVFEVAVALVCRQCHWLVARRQQNAHLGGLWEFPGGKCEPGETPESTALRELHEECGVRAAVERVLEPLRCDYGDRVVFITPVLCRWQDGAARPLGNDECRWVSLEELARLEMPAINARIISLIQVSR